jgi:cellulose synthase/poly-beta-1,6-N-acetylglucosamine synthase-like glycosyltransferase
MLVQQYSDKGVVSLFDPPRKGKTAALNRAVAKASGEILIFSDANTFFEKNSIRMLCRHFSDASVGGVSGLKCIYPDENRDSSEGDSLYWRYESSIKKSESSIGSIAGADGEIFAMRRKLYKNINEKVINDDAVLTFNIVQEGFRVVYDVEAKTVEYASLTLKDDFNVKVRMIVGGFQTIEMYFRFLLNPLNGFAWQFFFHKILRWLAPVFMILAFTSNLFLIHNTVFLIFLISQFLFYTAALMGLFLYSRDSKIKLFYIPFYFCLMNFAALKALIVWISNRALDPSSIWKKAKR